MDTVYKFCGEYGLEILQNLELKVTPPNRFNDPFEFTPKMVCSDPVACASRDLGRERNLRTLYEMLLTEGKFLGTFPQFQEIAAKRMPEWIQIMAEAPQHRIPHVEQEFLDEVSKRFGLLCLSGRRDSILMWGHYCDKPLGLVIGFDRSASVFNQGKGLRPVVYVKERVVYDYSWNVGSPEMLAYEDGVLLSKCCEWAYEAEWRQMTALAEPVLRRKPLKNQEGELGYFLPVPPHAIVSVTLSPRCSAEQEKKVVEALQAPTLAHVKLDRAFLRRDDFVLEFR